MVRATARLVGFCALFAAACADASSDAGGAGAGAANGAGGAASGDGFDDGSATCAPGSIPDRDGDGWSDAVEEVVGTSADDAKDNPSSRGLHVVLVPHDRDPSKGVEIQATTKLARADVGILLDTTGSMAGTMSRIQGQLDALFAKIAGLVDDVALGLAGYGDFPMNDGANSQYDVPFYLVHRMMTVRTKAGMSSLVGASGMKNIIVDGTGPWFAGMRGGDEPERGWEALKQAIDGKGIAYPGGSVAPFSAATAYPKSAPAGEEIGTKGGMGFRDDATPILIAISDTNNHPSSKAEALSALLAAHAHVVGLMAWKVTGHDDLTWIADQTGAKVSPDAWGTGAARPANCPVGKCCVVANDPSTYVATAAQPDPINGECTLVFQSDRYDENLATTIAQAIAGVAKGVPAKVSAEVRDDSGDAVDVNDAFVARVEACGDVSAVVPGKTACFRLVPKKNTTVSSTERAQRFDAKLALAADGIASLRSLDVAFVVPPEGECAKAPAAPASNGPVR